MKKILFLTQYFPPEIGAPQNRLYELSMRLQKKGLDVSILTAMPNYPRMEIMNGYQNKFYLFEEMKGLKIHRGYIFVRKSKSLIVRLINYFSFVLSSILIGIFKLDNHDYLFCESPPLFLGISAVLISRIKKAKLIFNVSDLWPESAEKLGLITNRFLINISTKLEEFLYRNSFLICGQTQGIVNNIKLRFPEKNIYWLKNGVDINLFYNHDNNNTKWKLENNFCKNDYLILYAGIFGYAQELEVILYAAKILSENENIKFILLGDGPEKEKLQRLKKNMNLTNVYFFDPAPKNQMPFIIASINASVIPLKKLELFKGAIPSKIFEILASKKPILLGVEGEAKSLFITEGNCGLAFTPEDSADLANNILTLYHSPELAENYGVNGYNYVKEKFNHDQIADDFYKQLN